MGRFRSLRRIISGVLQPPEEAIAELLTRAGFRLALAESCTGGLVGHRVTNVPGASAYYQGSITAYAYEAKMRLLGVQPETLDEYGAVSAETVLEMASGVRKALGAEVGLAISGIAGPGGGMPQKPVGLVYFGINLPGVQEATREVFAGGRVQVKEQAAERALGLLVEHLRRRMGQAGQ
jgi:PncC family amidohydrolase